MILGNVRTSLGRNDAQLALRLVARGSRLELERAEERLRDEGIDALLDDPRLVASLIESPTAAHASLALFFYVMVRQSLRNVGEEDRLLADYVAAILVHFAMRGRATRIAEYDDEEYLTLAALVDSLDTSDAQRAFLVRQHLGNYSLWLSGLYPEWISHRRWRRGGPDIDYYEALGRRGFHLAADHQLARQHGLATLLHDAAERFEVLRIALNAVSDSLLFPNHSSPDRLMRQVRDESRWKRSS